MNLYILLLVAAALYIVIEILFKKRISKRDPYHYSLNKVLLSAAERSFLGVLEKAIQEEYYIFPKVRLADLTTIKASTNRRSWQRYFNRISSKHVDFVLCSKDDLEIKCAIELNDSSHRRPARQKRDDFITGLCEHINLPFLQVDAHRTYEVNNLKELIANKMKPDIEISKISLSSSDIVHKS